MVVLKQKTSIELLWISEKSYLFSPKLKEIAECRTVLYESESDEDENDYTDEIFDQEDD